MRNRREFLQAAWPAAVIPAAGLQPPAWDAAVAPPVGYPVWNVRDFGAAGDRRTLDTAAIQSAIAAASDAGGGVVYVPPGDYVAGTIRVLSHVTLHLEGGATIWGSTDLADYDRHPRSLIYVEDAENVTIRGRGIIDGNGTEFFPLVDGRYTRPPGEGDRWETRPERLLRIIRCNNLRIEGVTLRNSPGWTLHPIDCNDVLIQGISIVNGIYADDGPNTDGITPDGCSRVRISDCYVQTGDDSIVLKVQEPGDGNRSCRDVVVTNCVLITDQSALKIGAGTHGDFRNITFSNCAIRDAGAGIGIWMRDGGTLDGFLVDNISMTLSTPETVTRVGSHEGGTVGGQPIYFWLGREDDSGPWSTVRNVTVSNLTAVADGSVFISGAREKHIENVTLENVRILMKGGSEKPDHADPGYPMLRNAEGQGTVWGHRLSPYDIFCRYVTGLTLRNVRHS